MNSDQEKLLQGLAVCRKIRQRAGQTADGRALFTDWAVPEEITALAQVVLELVEKAERNVFAVDQRHSLRAQMIEHVEQLLVPTPLQSQAVFARDLVDNMLDILDADPGHDVSAHVIRPGKDRGTTVAIYREFIQAIRRGE